MRIHSICTLLILLFSSCETSSPGSHTETNINKTSLVVLGTIQDAGSPQIGCKKKCCAPLFESPDPDRMVVSLGLVDAIHHKTYLFEATPDIGRQMKMLTRYEGNMEEEMVDGIFLTHAHIGHYTGLMYLGKEATDARNVPVYGMQRMMEFLSNNGPWDQLVSRQNIKLNEIEDGQAVSLSDQIQVTPLLVPHRDEYSETVGYEIKGPTKSALFIPDIDKWSKWETSIVEKIKEVDYAFLDATFYSGEELDNRDIAQIPHPFIIESLEKFKELEQKDKDKVVFIHFNHTNPVIDPNSLESKRVRELGFRIARLGDVFEL